MKPPWTTAVLYRVLCVLFFEMCTAQPSYYITTPSHLRPGIETAIAVHWFGNKDIITVEGGLWTGSRLLVHCQRTFKKNSAGLLKLPALLDDSTPLPSYWLFVNGSAQQESLFIHKVELPLNLKNMSAFIELDKSIYSPGQSVEIRVVCLNSYLKPFHGQIDILIKDPRKNTVQARREIKIGSGVISEKFLLSDDPPLGVWTIEVHSELQDFFVEQFTVIEYVQPKFEVTVIAPSTYVMSKKENATGMVIAKYSYGQPVIGNITIIFTSAFTEDTIAYKKTYKISGSFSKTYTYSHFLKLSGIFKNYAKVKMEDGVPDNLQWLDSVHLNITAVVTESLTGVTVSRSTIVILTYPEYVILDTAGLLRPQLDYIVKLKVLRSDQNGLTEEERSQPVSVYIRQSPNESATYVTSRKKASLSTIHWNTTVSTSTTSLNTSEEPVAWDLKKYSIPATGVIKVQFPVLASTNEIHIQVQYKNINHTIHRRVEYWQEECPCIQIIALSSPVQVGSAFQIRIESSENLTEINYVVLSKGHILAAGKQNTTVFSLIPESSWTPKATVTVYYIHKSGKVIGDSRIFSTEVVLKNKVSVSWSKTEAKPLENVTLTVIVEEPGSVIGLVAVENSPNVLGDVHKITAKMVEIDQELYGRESGGYHWTDAELTENVIQIEDDWSKFPFYTPRVQQRFTETWIWGELNISSGNRIDLPVTIPNMITSWAASAFVLSEGLGLGLTSEPAVLHVFQNFFISLNLPLSVTRGEEFVLEVVLFNYLTQPLKIVVTLKLDDYFDILFVSNATESNAPNRRAALMQQQSGATVFFPVRPKHLGEITFEVIATSPNSSEVISKKVLIKTEGIHKFYSQTVLLEMNNVTDTVSKSVSFTFPSDVVQGSELAFVSVTGDILGSSIDGLDTLVQMPLGCGEQNMINFCASVYVLKYLIATGRVTPDAKEKATDYLSHGYQKELAFLRDDGSFSAFGNSDAYGSTWLSAFVLKCLHQARLFIFIDENVINSTLQWLLRHLNNDTGEFLEPGHVIHTELQGGKDGSISLTAYILTALLEDELYRDANEVLSKSILLLEQKLEEEISSNHTLAIVTYALSLANSSSSKRALDQLILRADTTGGAMFWSSPAAGTDVHWQPRSSEIEIAAFALLSCYRQERTEDGRRIMKWLSKKRSPLGGFTSTQDTVLALQALSMFAATSSSSDYAMTVSVTGPEVFEQIAFEITSANLLELQMHKMDVVQHLALNFTASGKGTAVCQLNVVYNIKPTVELKSASNTDSFTLDIVVQDNPADLIRVALRVCTSYVPSVYGSRSGMALMEVHYLSGFSLDQSEPIQHELLKKVELQDGKVNLYFDSIDESPVCVLVSMLREAKVSSTQEATISIMDYYKPRTRVTKLYSSTVMEDAKLCAFCGYDCRLCRVVLPEISSDTGTGSGQGNPTNGSSNPAFALFLEITCAFIFWLIGTGVIVINIGL